MATGEDSSINSAAASASGSPGPADPAALTVEQVCTKVSGCKRGEVPGTATRLTMFVDVHDKLLYYCVCAWQEDFSGFVVEYGTFPDQRRAAFTLADASRTLGRAFPGMGADGAIHAGLEKLITDSLAREWKRGPGLAKIDRLLVDSGYKPEVVAAIQRKVGSAAVMLSKGVGIRASRRPIAAYTQKPGEVLGNHWYIPNVRRTAQFAHVLIDTNYWKSFVHSGLSTAMSDRGCISLYGTAKPVRRSLGGGGTDHNKSGRLLLNGPSRIGTAAE